MDLVAAALASVAANGLAAFLLAFAAHGRAHRPSVIDVTPTVTHTAAPDADDRERDPADEADRFARTTFRPNGSSLIKLADIRDAYHRWCRKHGLDPLPDHDIGQALNALFASVNLYRRGNGGDAAIVGIEWRHSEPLRLEGR